jgi:hypothetical protein
MNFIGESLGEGVKKGIEDSFLSIIDDLSDKIYTLIETTRVTTIGKEKYSEFVLNKVGKYNLFATSITANIYSAYVKVGLTNNIQREKYKPIEQIEDFLKKQKAGFVLEDVDISNPVFPYEAVNQSDNAFALIGSPGSGKTTAFRHLALTAAKGGKFKNKNVLPLFIQVRDLAKNEEKIVDYSCNFLNYIEIGNAKDVFLALLKSGKILLLLDGLDETKKEHQIELVKELKDLRLKYPKSTYCISARPFTLDIDLPNFKKWEVLPMPFGSRIEFVKNWFNNVNPEKGKILVDRALKKPELLDIGSNPLFLSIVCALFNNDLELPTNLDELYSRCVDGILGHWDAFRTIIRDTALKQFSFKERKIITSFVATYLFEHRKLVFSADDLIQTNCLTEVTQRLKKEIPPADTLLYSLNEDFGILVERAPGLFSFSHLTIQEYLVAEYIVNNRLEIKLCSELLLNDEYITILSFVIKLLPNADQFIHSVIQHVNFHNPETLVKLIEIIRNEPVCSFEMRKKVLNFIIAGLAIELNKGKRFLKIELNRDTKDVSVNIDMTGINAAQLEKEFSVIADVADMNLENYDEEEREILSMDKNMDKRDFLKLKTLKQKQKKSHSHFGGLTTSLAFLKELINIITCSGIDISTFGAINDNDFVKGLINFHGVEFRKVIFLKKTS